MENSEKIFLGGDEDGYDYDIGESAEDYDYDYEEKERCVICGYPLDEEEIEKGWCCCHEDCRRGFFNNDSIVDFIKECYDEDSIKEFCEYMLGKERCHKILLDVIADAVVNDLEERKKARQFVFDYCDDWDMDDYIKRCYDFRK